MRVGVFGTGDVGNVIGTKLVKLGHKVKMGSRSPHNPKAVAWAKKEGLKASYGTFSDAALFGEVLFNCTPGMVSLEALKMAGAGNLGGKVLIDVANPLDFSMGMPPSLSVSNTDSLGEQIQRAFPTAKVVKTLNTVNHMLMVNPRLVKGEHDVFLCGNDAQAKAEVVKILKSFGWKSPIDLGDITASRGAEMVLPLWVSLMSTYQNPMFNFKVVR